MATVCVIGLGAVGLPTAVLLARAGHRVVGADRSDLRRGELARGEVGPEPGLREVWDAVSIEVVERPVPAEVTVICVPTPLTNGAPDLSYVEDAVGAARCGAGDLLIIESTVSVGTTAKLGARLSALGVHIAVAPERVLPGNALHEIVSNPRVVGGLAAGDAEAAVAFYRSFVVGEILVTSPGAAELSKLIENSARDVQIALAHTAEQQAVAAGIDPKELWRAVNRHPRVQLLQPGVGVGGHCLPVDPLFLAEPPPLVRTARAINDARPALVAERISQVAAGRPIALLGASYKANVADTRNAPALSIHTLLAASHDVVLHDPLVGREASTQGRFVVKLVNHDVFADLPVDLDCSGAGFA